MNPQIEAGRIDRTDYRFLLYSADGNAGIRRNPRVGKTTLVLVEASGGRERRLRLFLRRRGHRQTDQSLLSEAIKGRNAFDIPGAHAAMVRKIRNLGRPGIASMAISAVDNALWDLKAQTTRSFPAGSTRCRHREGMVYGSGGFTSYSVEKLEEQLGSWAAKGMKMVK